MSCALLLIGQVDGGLVAPLGGGIAAIGGFVLLALKFPRESTAAAVDIQAKVLSGANTLTDQLQEELVIARARVVTVEEELDRLRAEHDRSSLRVRQQEEALRAARNWIETLEHAILDSGKELPPHEFPPPPPAAAS